MSDIEQFRSRRARRACNRVSTFSDTRFRRFKGNSTTASTATQTQIAENRQVAASEGATAIGAGSTVTYNSLDAQVVKDAVNAVSEVSTEAISSGTQNTKLALDFGGNTVDRTLDFASDFTTKQLEAAARASQDAANLARSSNETVAAAIQKNAGDATATVVQDALKSAMYTVLGLAAVGGIILVVRKK